MWPTPQKSLIEQWQWLVLTILLWVCSGAMLSLAKLNPSQIQLTGKQVLQRVVIELWFWRVVLQRFWPAIVGTVFACLSIWLTLKMFFGL